jgi:hypothetical protein
LRTVVVLGAQVKVAQLVSAEQCRIRIGSLAVLQQIELQIELQIEVVFGHVS